PGAGTVYTETVVFSPAEAFVNDVPYQLTIVTLDNGRRLTGRIVSGAGAPRAVIGDRVVFAEFRNGIPFFRKPS
ncbi:MAG: OB-fold domain-containing protein, partial [Bryobacteraceae bacterium]